MWIPELVDSLIGGLLAQSPLSALRMQAACTVSLVGVSGTCQDVASCSGFSTPGLCAGPANIQCCTATFADDHGASTGDVDDFGLKLIENFEGWSATFYRDAAGVRTIGWGHACIPDSACDSIHEPITREQGDELLRADVQDKVQCINRHVRATLTQNEFDALLSFTFNEGCGNLQNIAINLNAGDFSGATERMKLYNKVKDPATGHLVENPTLRKRRQIEVNVFNSYP